MSESIFSPAIFMCLFQKDENGLPQDRRLCTDGLIIRAQAMIRADGFRPRKLGEGVRAACKGLRAARANHVQFVRMDTIRTN
jgi:hypothetical protein